MDPIAHIHYKKDSTLAMLWEADRRGWEIFYFETSDLFLQDGRAYGHSRKLNVFQDSSRWFEFQGEKTIALSDLNVILMRKDPPFNLDYIYATQILDYAEQEGVLVVNKPQSLRDANEKLFTASFPQCCPPTLVGKGIKDLKQFLNQQGEIVCKPLHAMGGQSIFYLRDADVNATVIFETLTQNNTQYVMAQRFIPEIKLGDKRILLIDGQPIPYSLARIPPQDDFRGNLAVGAKGIAQDLTQHDRWICEQLGPTLREKGLYFVGIDVIGEYLTEINVTSPTCIRELDEQCGLNISATLMDFISSAVK